jgi:glycosyltransferase involved in cell wall biosynthesis
MDKPKLLVLSHVLPFPRSSGQEQRVFYTLQAVREVFHVTFATFVGKGDEEEIRRKLLTICDDALLLPSRYSYLSEAGKTWRRAVGSFQMLRSGLKWSNYVIGQLEFSQSRIVSLLASGNFDCVLFEYWHAAGSTDVVRGRGIPCVLDMHDILWQAYGQELADKSGLPGWWKRWSFNKYKSEEEHAWKQFDGVIAINREEMRYVEQAMPRSSKVFYAPMGTNLTLWPYSWKPSQPMRVAYYGSFRSPHNQQSALRCFKRIMPEIWRSFPETEFWLVGNKPPESIRVLSDDPRVKVTGYVEDVQAVLRTMSAVLCPWSGTYGFRSRLVEVMALGVPVVATPDAVSGMEFEDGNGLLLGQRDSELARCALRLIGNRSFAAEQSARARQSIEHLYSLETTYVRLARELSDWLKVRRPLAGSLGYTQPKIVSPS